MVYEELLSWSRNRPLWQQDALRRIALHGELTDDDLAEFRLHIQHTEGLPAENVPVLVPLAAEHLSHAISNDPRTVSLHWVPSDTSTGYPPTSRPFDSRSTA